MRLTSLVSGNLTPLNVVFSAADPLLLMHFLVTLHCCLLSLLHDLLLLLMLLQLLLVRGILPLHFRSLYNTIAHLKCVPKQKSLSRNTQRVVSTALVVVVVFAAFLSICVDGCGSVASFEKNFSSLRSFLNSSLFAWFNFLIILFAQNKWPFVFFLINFCYTFSYLYSF